VNSRNLYPKTNCRRVGAEEARERLKIPFFEANEDFVIEILNLVEISHQKRNVCDNGEKEHGR
jgi:hypothetical protein